MAGSPFDNFSSNFVRSPLGIIALFIVLVYAIAGLVAAFGDAPPTHLLILVIFLVSFPVLVLGVFYRLVTRHSNLIYGPSDFRDDTGFLSYRGTDPSADTLRRYWKPDGHSVSEEHNTKLLNWMRQNDIKGTTVMEFMFAEKFRQARLKASRDLGLA